MSNLKEVNFWLIYFIISGVIILISCLIFYSEWRFVKTKYEQQLESLNRISSQNTLSSFRNQESILKILGKNLLHTNARENPESGRLTVEEMIEVNKGLVAFGLARYDGQLLLVSNIPKGKSLPNLMKLKNSKESFKIARDSTKMMLGRTYQLKASKSWGMPIRMAIKDSNGKIPLVMTAAIRLDGGDSALNLKELPKDFLVQVVRSDGYVQFQNPINEKNLENIYYKKFDNEIFERLKRLKNNRVVLFDSYLTGKRSISTALYIKEFDLYTIVSVPYKRVTSEYISILIYWIIPLLIVLFVIYFLFKYSINLQQIASGKLNYLARHDSLTNLPNRLSLHEELDRRISNDEIFYLMFLDLDNFKHVNDTYGHSLGDKLLIHVANVLRKLKLKDDFLARQSGDEFILLIRDSQKEPVRNLTYKILDLLSKEIMIDNTEVYSSVSIGISKHNNKKENASELLNKADIALYKAKERKNSCVFFSDEIYKESKNYLQIEANLRKALKNHEFHLVYQPKIDAKTNKLIGVEALIRWKNDFLGVVSPEIFIPVAEKCGVIDDIGDYVIKQATTDIKSVWEELDCKITLSVNVSPRQLSTKKDMVKFKNYIKKNEFPNKYFIIEVTENIFIKETQKTISFLEKLRGYNIGVSLDDFGTGYSSLSILSRLPITELKIDKSFVQNMLLNEDNLTLVKSIINIGKQMRLKVVAEGVETKEELKVLDEMGCEIYQGYYFSKPLKKEDLIDYIKNQN